MTGARHGERLASAVLALVVFLIVGTLLGCLIVMVPRRGRPTTSRWVVRENVPAPDALHFALGLAAIGYGVVGCAEWIGRRLMEVA